MADWRRVVFNWWKVIFIVVERHPIVGRWLLIVGRQHPIVV
ncbi:hypothetical protein ACT8ZR_12640 [Neobacillus sp. M.A.Huq-85]